MRSLRQGGRAALRPIGIQPEFGAVFELCPLLESTARPGACRGPLLDSSNALSLRLAESDNRAVNSEAAYLFRHALLRDAAYQLQLPGNRANLHALAFGIIEALHGGRAPEPPPLNSDDAPALPSHPTDGVALELAEHARLAMGDGEGLQAESLLYLRRAAEYMERVFRGDDSASAWQALAPALRGTPKGEALRRAGAALRQVGRGEQAERTFVQALAIFREVGDRRSEGLVLGNLAGIHHETGRAEQAERTYGQALAIHREVGNRRFEGVTLTNLATLYHATGRIEQAERTFGDALAILRDTGNRRFEGGTLGNLAILYHETGRVEEAERLFVQALAIHREVGDRLAEGPTLGNLAALYQVARQVELSERTFEHALRILRETANRRSEGLALGSLASLYQNTGRLAEAERTYVQALAIHREVGNRPSEGIALGNLAGVYHDTGRVEEAEQTFRRALAIHREVGHRRFEGLHQCDVAICLLVLKHPREARAAWLQGAAILETLRDSQGLQQVTAGMRKACADAGAPPFDQA